MVELLHVVLVNVAIDLFQLIHLVDEEVDLGVLGDDTRRAEHVFNGFTPVLCLVVYHGLFFVVTLFI